MYELGKNSIWLFILMILWVLPWKGYSLWVASHKGHKWWFIALLILNTFGLIDIFYIFYIAKKNPKDIIKAVKSLLHIK